MRTTEQIPGPLSFEITTRLPVSPEVVWRHATTMAGIRDDMWPLARMTAPRWAAELTPENIPLGKRMFRSWILLFGVVPVEYDDLTIVELEPGRRFFERSTMLTQREWQHERIVEPEQGGCRITDRVKLVPRLGLAHAAQAAIARTLFRHRHKRLVLRFSALTL